MSEQKNEQHSIEENSVAKTLWVFECTHAHLSVGSLHLFYAANEQEACTYVGDYIRRATARGERLEFRHLKAYPHGFSAGYTTWLGNIHVRPDGTLMEGTALRSIERVAYKGNVVEQSIESQ